MFYRSIQVFILLAIGIFGTVAAAAQGTDASSPLTPKSNEKDQAEGVRDMLEKMRIEKDKRDHAEMLKRGDEALNLSNELEKSLKANQNLTEKDLAKLETLEKLVKRIRGELGGGDDEDATERSKEARPADVVEGVKALRSVTLKLVDELKKTTRFSISAAAIQSSNAVLRLARFLRLWK
jgi:hypothetical protein